MIFEIDSIKFYKENNMKFNRLNKRMAVASLALFSVFFLTNCTSMITKEQLAKMGELRQKEATLTQDIVKSERELSGLKKELKDRQSEVAKCKEESDFVKSKLNDWPNVWPKK